MPRSPVLDNDDLTALEACIASACALILPLMSVDPRDNPKQEAGEHGQDGDVGNPKLIGPSRRRSSSGPDRAPAGADKAGGAHQASHALLADRHAVGLELGVHARRATDLVRGAMNRVDLPGYINVSRRPQRRRPVAPSLLV